MANTRIRRSRERDKVHLAGVARRTKSALLVSTALQAVTILVLAVPAGAQPAPNARPVGGVVVGGTASIAQTATGTTIDQSSQRAAINWQSFNVGSAQSVTFEQPNTRSIALNTVTGPNPSQIAGRINANGQVVLVNQSGVTFYKGSQVNTAGLMVSAAAADPKAFMRGGNIAFNQPGRPDARIINNGNITISGAGLASLVAPGVANAGVIDAKLGHVVLAGAKTATLDLYGDKLVSVNVTGAVTQAPDGTDALVTNTGVIKADGGTVRLTARAVDGVVTNLVTAGGTIRARGTDGRRGKISIDGVGGSITITGDLDATGNAAGTTGGKIGLLASNAVIVKSGATVAASGAAGGGTIAIGTTLKRAQGGPAITGARMAKSVVVQAGATIAADATATGNGGRVTVLSSDATAMSGLITAKGGPSGGDGGFVEVSGAALSLLGGIDVTAPAGNSGTILLDPTNLTVVGSNGNLDSSITGGGTLLASVADNPPDTVSTANLSGNILLQAQQTLTVSSALSTTGSITLEAGGTINVNAGVSATGDVILATGGAGPSGAPAAQASPLISVMADVSSSAGSVSMLSGPGGTIALGPSVVVLVTGNNKLATFQTDTLTVGAGAQTQNLAGAIEIAPASVAAMHLGGAGGLSLSQSVLTSMTGLTLRLGGATAGGQVITTASAISVDGSINLSGVTPTLDLRSTGAVTQSAALTGGMALTGNTGAVTLNHGGNGVVSVGDYTVNGGGFTLTAANALGVNGDLSATGGNVVLNSTGNASAIGIASTGTLAGASSGTVTAQADTFTNAGAVTGGTFEYASNTPGVLTVGTGGNIASLTGVATANVRLGSADGTVTATGITTASSFDLGVEGVARPLDLQATGSVTDGGAFAFLNVSTLTGNVSGGSLALTANAAGVANVGDFTVSGGSFTLQQPSGTLSVSGSLIAPSVTLASGNLTIAGTISTGGSSTGSVSLVANTGTISETGAIATGTLGGSASGTVNLPGADNQIGTIAALTTGGLTVVDGTALALAGNVSAGPAGTVDISTTGAAANLTQTGTLVAGVLTSTGGVSGAALLQGPSNVIGTISGFAVTGSLVVIDGAAMTVAGVVGSSGGNVFVTTGANALTFAPGGTLVSKDGGRIGIEADGLVNIGGPETSGVVNAGVAGVFEFAPSTASLPVTLGSAAGPSLSMTTGITAGTFRIGAVTLPGSTTPTINTSAIAIAGTFDVSGAALELDAAGGISQSAPLLNVAILSGAANTGSVVLSDPGNTVASVGGFTAGGGFTLADATDLTMAGVLSATAVSLTAPGISIPGSITTGGAAAGSVSLIASATTIGGVGVITTGTLNGSAAGSITLSGANQIGTLGSLSGGAISLNDGVPLAIGNTVSAVGTVALTSTGLLAVESGATVAASGVTLTATGLAIDGLVTTAGTLGLLAAAGSITESGTLIADTLTGSAGTSASLAGATPTVNQIATLGPFTAAGFTLDDGAALTVTGTVNGGAAVTIANTGLLTNNGTIAGTAINLTADNLALGGVVTDGGSGTVSLVARANGTIEQTGTLIAGVLSGSAGGTVTLTGASATANQVGTIGPFSGAGILLNDGAALTVASTLNGNAGTAALTTSGLLSIAGTVTAAAVALTGSAIAPGGLVTDGGAGTVNLTATSGSIGETGSIVAGTLNGSAATSASLSGANTIAAVGSFSAAAGTIALVDGAPLAVTGTLSGANGVSVADAGLMTISGLVGSPAGNVVLLDTSANGIRLAGGSVIATGNTVSVAASALAITAPGTIVAGTFEFGPPVNGGTVTFGGSGFPAGGAIGAATIRVGGVNGTVTAGAIVIAGFDNGNRPLELDATGTVSQTGSLTGVANLTGTAASFQLTGPGNTIGTLGGGTLIAVGTAGLAGTLAVEDASALALSGLVSAGGTGTVDLSTVSGKSISQAAGATLVAGVLTSTNQISGALNLRGLANHIGTIGNLTALGGITVVDGQGLALAGLVSPGGAGTLDLSVFNGGGVTQNAAGTLIAAVLTSSGGIAGDIILRGTGNQLGTISALTATGITVVDGSPLTLAGLVSAGAPGTVDISTNSGSDLTQAASGTLIAGVLTSANGVGGNVLLRGTANQIGTISGLAINGGALIVVNSQALSLSGLVSAGTVDISTSGGGDVTQGAAGTLIAGVLTSGGGIAGDAILRGGANQIGTISGLIAAGLTIVDSQALTLAGEVSAGTGGTVDLSGPGVTQAAGGTLIAGLLTSSDGISGGVILRGTANAIGSIAGLSATGLTVVDSAALTLTGQVSVGAAGSVDISSPGVSQAAGGTLIAGVLTSANGVSGGEILQGTANQIGTISGLTAGGLVVVDSTGLVLAGKVSAGIGGTIDITTSGAGSNLVQTGTLVARVLTSTGGIAGTASLLGPSNSLGTISGFTAAGSLVAIDGSSMTVAGVVGSSGGNVFVTPGAGTLSFAAGGSLVSKSGGTIGIEADSLGNLGTIGATGAVNAGAGGVFEFAPATASLTLTLGATAAPSLATTTGITAGMLRPGAVTLPGGSGPTVNAASIAVAGTFNANGDALELDATGAVTQSAPLLNVSALTGTAASYTLTNAGNAIGRLGGGTLTAATGTIAVIDVVPLVLAGTVSATGGNVFISSGGNALSFAAGATLASKAGGTIGLQAGSLGNLGATGATGAVRTAGGLFELAPGGTTATLTLGGSGGLALVNLTGIGAASLRLGSVTLPGAAAATTTAGSIAVAGAFDASGLPLELDATGAVTQTAPLLNVATLTGTAGGFALTNAGNTIGQVGGGTLTASTGMLAIEDSIGLIVAGTVKAAAGDVSLDTLAGNGLADNRANPITFAAGGSVVSRAGGTITVAADFVVNLGTTGATGVIDTGGGVFELVPLLANPVTLGTASTANMSLTNLTGIDASLLRAGASGNATNASAITIAGTFDAQGRRLELDAIGAVSQTAPLLNVSTLTGTAGSFTLTNAGNTIGQLGGGTLTATLGMGAGTIAIVDGTPLIVAGTVAASAGDVFLETAAGDALTFAPGAAVFSQTGGTIGILTDRLVNLGTTGATGVVNAGTAGLFELAPVSTFTETLGAASGSGVALIHLTGITAGTVRIGGVTVPGGVAPAVTAGSIAVAGTFNAASITTLDLEAKGTISQSAPIINLATLIASTNGVPGDIALGDTLNSIGTIGSFSLSTGTISFGDTPLSGSYLVSSGQTILANNVFLTVAGTLTVDGNVIASGPAGNVMLAATGATSDLFVGGGALLRANGTVSLTSGRDISQTGGVINGGSVIETAGGSLSAGAVVSAVAVSLTGANISISGEVTDGGTGTVSLIATGGTIGETGTLIAGTLSGGSTGGTDLSGATATTNQIATIGDFTAAGAAGFRLNDGADLAVAGTLNAVAGAFITDSGALAVGGVITSTNVGLTGASIVIPGVVTAGAGGSIGLIATNGSIGETGTMIAQSLTGSSTGTTRLTGASPAANRIASLGDFTAAGFTLNDGMSVSIVGTLNGGASASITGGASISVPGTIAAAAVSLSGTNITIGGLVTDGGAGSVGLIATGGTINETGTLIAGTLSGGSAGATTLTGTTAAANQVGTIGPFTAAGFTLNDGASLTVAGMVNGGTAATIADSAPLTVAGTVTAAAVSLTGANIAIPGLVTDGGAGTVGLIATTGTINETGTLIAGTLSGGANGAATLSGATATTNQVGTIASFTANGFTLNDGAGLTVAGVLNGGTAATIADSGPVSVTGTVTAAAISLGGANLALPGLLTDGGAGTVALIATGGTINQTGTMIVGTLSGSSTGATSLTGASATANQIATIDGFSAAGLTVNDGRSVAISGLVNGGTRATIAGSALLTVSGTLTATAVSLTGTALAISGLVTDGGAGTVALTASGGAIDETGTLIAGTLSGGSSGATELNGATATANQVATIGDFSGSGFSLNDGRSLTVSGVLNGGSGATIVSSGLLTVGGTIAAAADRLTAANIAISGLVTDGGAGTVVLVATSGMISEPGTLIAATLSGSSAGAAMLTGASPTANQVAAIGTFTAAGFTLNDGRNLTVSGTVGGGASATIEDSALLTVGGTVSAAAVGLTAANIVIAGLVTDGGSGTTGLFATGGTITETGTLIVGTLSGSSTGATALTGATNRIATIDGFAAAGFSLNDGASLTIGGLVNGGTAATIVDSASLTVAGTVTATAISLTGANVAIPGLVTDGGAGTVGLIATGGTINESGTLIAGTLSGSSTGATTLGGTTATANQVGTVGVFTASGFTMNDGASLTVAGEVNGGSAATIVDSAPLTVAGTVTAAAVSLTGVSISIPGLVTDGGGGTVALIATGGTINETGTLIAGTLSGSSTGATTLTGATPAANQIGTIGGFSAVGFSLNDGETLLVSGPLNGGIGAARFASIVDTGLLTVGGTVVASAISLTGADIAIPGEVTDGGSGTVRLIATAGTINETGSLVAGTLSGSSTGATTLTGATPATNQVANLGTFTAAGFTLNDGAGDDGALLAISGMVNGGTAATITDGGPVTVLGGGTVSATAISLTAANISIVGVVTDGGSGTVNLIATAGTIGQGTGTLIAGTLSGSSTGATSLTGLGPSSNQVATLEDFTAAGFTLVDGKPLSVAGVLNGGTAATIVDSGALSVGGTIGASGVSLTATGISIAGEVTDGGAGTVRLFGTLGAITETGTLIAGTLSGSSSGTTTLNGATPATNQVASIGTFTAAGFTLNDGTALTVSGTLNGGPAATITDSALLTIGGTVSAAAIGLTGLAVAIPGLVTNGGFGTVGLIATGGTINEPGTLIAETLSGSSTGATTLTGATAAANQIETLAGFTAAGFSLNDGAFLTVSGPVNGGASGVIKDGQGLTILGTVSATAIDLQGTSITIFGAVIDASPGTVNLVATNGTISEGGSGTVIAGTLSGSSTAATSLTSANNQVDNLGSFVAAGFALNDGAGLSINGMLNGGTAVTIADRALLSVVGTVSAAAVSLTGANVAISGLVTDGGGGSVSLVATAGTIDAPGTLIAGALSGGSTGAASFSGSVNRIATVTNFNADGFLLNDNVDLSLTGSVASGGAFMLTDTGNLTIGADSVVSGATIVMASTGNATIAGSVTSAGTGGISVAGTLSIPGVMSATKGWTILSDGGMTVAGTIVSPAGTVGITGLGGLGVPGLISGQTGVTIGDTGAMIVAGTIGSGGGTVGITNAGALAIPGLISGQTGVTLAEIGDMNVAGSIVSAAGVVSITDTGAMTVEGTISGQTGVTQSATGDMNLSGVLSSGAGAVEITDGGVLSLINANGVANSAGVGVTTSIVAATSITITDLGTMTLGGLLSAPRIVVNNGSGSATFLPGTRIVTSGRTRPRGSLSPSQLPNSANPTDLGFYMTTGALRQTGTLTVTGTPSVMRIDASTGIELALSPAGIIAPNTWLILGETNGAKASGFVEVLNLDAFFTGAVAGSTLTGSVGGLNGDAAAGASGIVPGTNSTFRINGCPIASINCVLLTTQGIPAASPLRDFVIGSVFDPSDEDDLLLPLVSDEVY